MGFERLSRGCSLRPFPRLAKIEFDTMTCWVLVAKSPYKQKRNSVDSWVPSVSSTGPSISYHGTESKKIPKAWKMCDYWSNPHTTTAWMNSKPSLSYVSFTDSLRFFLISKNYWLSLGFEPSSTVEQDQGQKRGGPVITGTVATFPSASSDMVAP